MKKGFTLIELLAVIVILGIISIIIVPILMNIIEKTKIGAAESSATNFIGAVESQVATNLLMKSNMFNLDEENDYTLEELTNKNVKVKGKIGDAAVRMSTKGIVTTAYLCVNGFSIQYNNGKSKRITTDNYCNGNIVLPLILFDNGLYNSKHPLIHGSYEDQKYFTVSDVISYNDYKNSYLYFENKIENKYKKLKIFVKAINKGQEWSSSRAGVRPTYGSDGTTDYINYFVPKDWYAYEYIANNTTVDLDYRIFEVNLTNISSSVVDYYFYLHAAGENITIKKIWFE